MDNIRIQIHSRVTSFLLPIDLTTATTLTELYILCYVDKIRDYINHIIATATRFDEHPNEWSPR
jgi:hypothetical protein